MNLWEYNVNAHRAIGGSKSKPHRNQPIKLKHYTESPFNKKPRPARRRRNKKRGGDK